MITTKINIKQHLAEYICSKYGEYTENKSIRFPHRSEIYHAIFHYTEKRPVNCPVDSGNLEIVLPKPDSSKQPKTYNYLSIQSQKKIERLMDEMFWADFILYVEHKRHKTLAKYIDLVFEFRKKYRIISISEDAMIKYYYRWRKKVRDPEKRAYKFKKNLDHLP